MTDKASISRLGAVDIAQFKPKSGTERRPTAAEIDKTARLPRREVKTEGIRKRDGEKREMLGINTTAAIAERFRDMAKDTRSYGRFLEILMDSYEQQRQG